MAASKTLLGLLIVVAGLVYYLYHNEGNGTENNVFIQSLNTSESDLSHLTRVLVSQGEKQFDMRKVEESWYLNGGFYARMDSLFKWVQALKAARLIESKTANPANFSDLSLTEDDLRVRLFQNNQLLSDVILGQNGAMVGTRFVRYFDNNQSWLASGLVDLQSSEDVWLLTLVFDIPENQVQAIELIADDGLRLIKNAETGQWQRAENDLNNNEELNQDNIQKLAAALSGFRIEQAIKNKNLTEQPMQKLVFGLEQGRQVTITVYQEAGNTFIKLSDTQQPGAYDDWQFTVPNYKLATLQMNRAALLKTQTDDAESITPTPQDGVVKSMETKPAA